MKKITVFLLLLIIALMVPIAIYHQRIPALVSDLPRLVTSLKEFWRGRAGTPSVDIPWEKSLTKRLDDIGWQKGSPVFIRIFKEENILEMYGQHNGQWVFLKDWPICKWSGKLGPKFAEGDRQSPEGFYMVSKKQLNPFSNHHLAFNLGFPNQVELEQGKTGSYLMVHGNCSSIGCYAMTNPAIDEIYGIVEEALKTSQKSVPVHAFPFHLSEENLKRHSDHTAISFWRDLKRGYDYFEIVRQVPEILACGPNYEIAGQALLTGEQVKLAGGTGSQQCNPLRGW